MSPPPTVSSSRQMRRALGKHPVTRAVQPPPLDKRHDRLIRIKSQTRRRVRPQPQAAGIVVALVVTAPLLDTVTQNLDEGDPPTAAHDAPPARVHNSNAQNAAVAATTTATNNGEENATATANKPTSSGAMTLTTHPQPAPATPAAQPLAATPHHAATRSPRSRHAPHATTNQTRGSLPFRRHGRTQ